MEKSKIKERMLRYWVKLAENEFCIMLAIFAGFALWGIVFISGESIIDVLGPLPIGVMFIGTLMVFSYSIANMHSASSIALSFGSTRKEVFIGQQITNGILIVQLLITYTISAYIINNMVAGKEMIFGIIFLGMLFFAIGTGQLGCAIYSKKGSGAVVIYILVVSVLVGLTIILTKDIIIFVQESYVVIAVAGFLIYLCGSIFNYFNIKKLEVKL